MDKNLKKAIKDELIESPSKGFTDKVMNSIFELQHKKEVAPILSKKAWWFIGFAFAALVVLIVVNGNTGSEDTTLPLFQKLGGTLEDYQLPEFHLFEQANLLIVSAVSFALLLLLTFDSFLFKRK